MDHNGNQARSGSQLQPGPVCAREDCIESRPMDHNGNQARSGSQLQPGPVCNSMNPGPMDPNCKPGGGLWILGSSRGLHRVPAPWIQTATRPGV
jgi:hypothetical protein